MEPKSAQESCFYCSAPLYRLKEGSVKCSRCKKKYSLERIRQIQKLIFYFCRDENALSAAKKTGLTYATVSKYFQKFRYLSAEYCETQYEQFRSGESQYEEYVYLEKSKRTKKEAIFDSHNFLTFAYGDRVYNILMPSLNMYKHQFLADNLEDLYYKEFSKFMRTSKIIKVSERYNTITRFWNFFESFIIPYKGVSNEFFPYYLKEAEFKFNFSYGVREKIITTLYFHPSSGTDI